MPSTPLDITNAVVPLWSALVGLGGILTALGAIVVWVFSNFETKESHQELAKRVDSQETLLATVARDVSYIRGRMESNLS